eukprot:TRINITY_DN13058_c0_g1_i1.p1 TRINITY_DN13058_c0_g1~~TRINITY_DN13058_c0_g1_i1.p1  ORF type:complete len:501 (+),score=156.93 TRINITY_DN13058_c0_g1_i1:228-1505(+)
MGITGIGPRNRILSAIESMSSQCNPKAEVVSPAKQEPIKRPISTGVYLDDCMRIHNAIHDRSSSSVVLSTGEKIDIKLSSNKCRSASVRGTSFMEQNISKVSAFTQRAKKGHKLTWILFGRSWGLLCDDRVEITCGLIDYSHQDKDSAGLEQIAPEQIPEVPEAKRSRLVKIEVEYPEYWTDSLTEKKQIELDPKSEEFARIAATVKKTMEQSVEVIRIQRLQHPLLWQQYYLRRKVIQELNAKDTSGGPEKIAGAVKTPLLDVSCNEYQMFHGCNASVVDKIASDGFDERLSSLKGLFGSGIYFAENAIKSAQYAHISSCQQVGAVYAGIASKCTCKSPSQRGEERMMFVSRVALGTTWVRLVATDSSNPMRRPPQRVGSACPLYDSVMGQSKAHDKQAKLPYREFIVYDRQQCYPEYIVSFAL